MDERPIFVPDEIDRETVNDPATRLDRAYVIYHSDVIVDCVDLVARDSGTEFNLGDELRSIIGQEEWHTRAACRGKSDVNFFPTGSESARAASAFCAACAVTTECLEYALAHEHTVGVWGGMTERERKRLRHCLLAS